MLAIYHKYSYLEDARVIKGYAPAYFFWVILATLLFLLRNIII